MQDAQDLFPAGRPAEVADAPIPVPGSGQLLVRTEAVGVGVGLVRMLRAGDAVRPGGEMVGTVVAVGPDVAGFELGDRVGGVVFEDVYAEIVLADPRLVSYVPAEVDPVKIGRAGATPSRVEELAIARQTIATSMAPASTGPITAVQAFSPGGLAKKRPARC